LLKGLAAFTAWKLVANSIAACSVLLRAYRVRAGTAWATTP
jgi:hypothetical protein